MNADGFLPNAETVAAIEKDVAIYNERRKLEHAELERRLPALTIAYVAGSALVLYVSYLLFIPDGAWMLGIIAALCVFGWRHARNYVTRPAEWTQQHFRDHMLPVLFGFIPDLRYSHDRMPVSFERMPRQLIPGHNRKEFDDFLSGLLDGRRFELFEMKLVQRSKNSETVMFQGAVLNCKLATPFPGFLVATRKVGDFQRFFRDLFASSAVSEIVCGDERLDRLYEFRTDRRSEARRLLSGGLAEILAGIWKKWPNDTAQLAVSGDDVFVMLPSDTNFFELPPIERPLDYHADLAPMVRHIASFLAIAGEVQKLDAVTPAVERDAEGGEPAPDSVP